MQYDLLYCLVPEINAHRRNIELTGLESADSRCLLENH
jgi:hypothetical protein